MSEHLRCFKVWELRLPYGVLLYTRRGYRHYVAALSDDRARVLFRASFAVW